jgi:hypothetical protein
VSYLAPHTVTLTARGGERGRAGRMHEDAGDGTPICGAVPRPLLVNGRARPQHWLRTGRQPVDCLRCAYLSRTARNA